MLNFLMENDQVKGFWETGDLEVINYIKNYVFAELLRNDHIESSNIDTDNWNATNYTLEHVDPTILEYNLSDFVTITLKLHIVYIKETYYSLNEIGDTLKFDNHKIARPKSKKVLSMDKIITIKTKNFTIYQEGEL